MHRAIVPLSSLIASSAALLFAKSALSEGSVQLGLALISAGSIFMIPPLITIFHIVMKYCR